MTTPTQNGLIGAENTSSEVLPNDFGACLEAARKRTDSGDLVGSLAAIDKALSLQPRSVPALMMKADNLVRLGDTRAAAAFYAAVLRLPASETPQEWRSEVSRARDTLERYARTFEEYLRAQMDQSGFGPKQAPPRFSRAMDALLGKKRVYVQEPKYFFYPELAPIQFFERSSFQFLDAVEAAYSDIRGELDSLISDGIDFLPYLTPDKKRAPSTQRGLLSNTAWTAFFLMKDGERTAGAEKCPKTLSALANAPLSAIPGRTPAILFSRLQPGAHIPAHTGMINTRLICHLALKTNDQCMFRVGNETRVWEQGKAWVFDDTIEHEAWNRSSEDRTVLIFDIWRPDIPEDERLGIIALCEAIDGFNGRQRWEE